MVGWEHGLLPSSVPGCGTEEETQHRADNERTMIQNSSFQTCGEIQVGTSELDFDTRWPCQNHVLIFHLKIAHAVSLIQFSSVTQLCLTLQPHELQHTRLLCPSPTLGAYSDSSIESVMPSNHLILCRSLLPPPSIFPSIRVFSNESVLRIRWPKYWSFNFSISPSNEYSGLISFRMDWLDLFAVQGTLRSLLQHHSSKASILQCSAFFIVQLSHPYLTTAKTIALGRQTSVAK